MNIGFNTQGHFWFMKLPKGTKLHCGYCLKNIILTSIFYYCKTGDKAVCESCMFDPKITNSSCKWNFKLEREHNDYCIKQVEYDKEE